MVGSADVDLQRLTQSQVSWLIGRPTSWLRNNSQLFMRDSKGRYDARKVVEVTKELAAEPAEISNEHFEVMHEWLYSVTNYEGRLTGCLRVLDEIVDEHRAAGLAAIGQMVKDIAENHCQQFAHSERMRTEAEIRRDGLTRIEQEIAAIPKFQAVTDMRDLITCEFCGKYRWGRVWKEPPLPPGYISSGDTGAMGCPECEAEREH